MTRIASFFNDRRGLATIDYGFVAALAWGVHSAAGQYGEAAVPFIRHALHIA